MKDLEIFDKDGKALHIADVIYSFIKDKAEESKKDIEDVHDDTNDKFKTCFKKVKKF